MAIRSSFCCAFDTFSTLDRNLVGISDSIGFHRIVFVLFWFSRCFFSLRISDSASSHRSKSDFSMFENLDPTRPLSHLKGQQRCREAIHPGFQTTPRRTAGRFTNMFTLQVPPNMGYSLVKYHNFW